MSEKDETSKLSTEKTNIVDPDNGAREELRYKDDEFGGPEERKRLERKLLWKLDCRFLILVVIYILNYVSIINLGPPIPVAESYTLD